jgi:hypothetical protein
MSVNRTFVAHALLGLVLCAKFIMTNQVQLAEALVYVCLGLTIASYWSFSAWLRLQEKSKPAANEEFDSLRKEVADLKTKTNAVLLKNGFGV